jgi:hypothetical protein
MIFIFIFFEEASASEGIVHPGDKFILLVLLNGEGVILIRYICHIVDLFEDIIAFHAYLAIFGADEYV